MDHVKAINTFPMYGLDIEGKTRKELILGPYIKFQID
jgi:hypothetical protein